MLFAFEDACLDFKRWTWSNFCPHLAKLNFSPHPHVFNYHGIDAPTLCYD